MKNALTIPFILLIGLLAVCILPGEILNNKAAKKVAFAETVELELEGWTIHAETSLVTGEHKELGEKALQMLANHLQRIAILLPEKQLADMRRMEIQIEHAHPSLSNMQYHPSVEWLTENGHDPALAKRVHITHADALLSRDQMLKHPAVILHELAHAYHDQILGFDEPETINAYDKAMEAGIYNKVLLFDGRLVQHYATTNHKEYFAEATEAYFYRNDFYPFVRAELRLHDPLGYALMEKIWGKID